MATAKKEVRQKPITDGDKRVLNVTHTKLKTDVVVYNAIGPTVEERNELLTLHLLSTYVAKKGAKSTAILSFQNVKGLVKEVLSFGKKPLFVDLIYKDELGQADYKIGYVIKNLVLSTNSALQDYEGQVTFEGQITKTQVFTEL